MNRLLKLFTLSIVLTLTACSTGPGISPTVTKPGAIKPPAPAKPIKPTRPPVLTELVGKYSLFAGSEISFGVSEQGGKLFVSTLGQTAEMQKVSATRFNIALLINSVQVIADFSPFT